MTNVADELHATLKATSDSLSDLAKKLARLESAEQAMKQSGTNMGKSATALADTAEVLGQLLESARETNGRLQDAVGSLGKLEPVKMIDILQAHGGQLAQLEAKVDRALEEATTVSSDIKALGETVANVQTAHESSIKQYTELASQSTKQSRIGIAIGFAFGFVIALVLANK